MCGRYTHLLTWRQIVELYRLTLQQGPPTAFAPRYNLAPTQNAPVVRLNSETGDRECVMLRWGLVPFWAKDDKIGYSTINARAESVRTKPAFREAFKRRRCIVPASGFYEWRAEGGKGKQPYCFRRGDGEPLSMAGLWERWQKGDAPAVESFTIIVCAANATMQDYHDRMPVILSGDEIDLWLSPDADPTTLESLLRPFAGELAIAAVSKAVNNPRNDNPDVLRSPSAA